jgi:hypothetical protein
VAVTVDPILAGFGERFRFMLPVQVGTVVVVGIVVVVVTPMHPVNLHLELHSFSVLPHDVVV